MHRNFTLRSISGIVLLFVIGMIALIPATHTSAAPPQGFQSQSWILNLTEPTAIAFTPDARMLILERAGKIWVAQPGAAQVDTTPFMQITNINIDQGERGAVGL
jgi:hypothetical protein